MEMCQAALRRPGSDVQQIAAATSRKLERLWLGPIVTGLVVTRNVYELTKVTCAEGYIGRQLSFGLSADLNKVAACKLGARPKRKASHARRSTFSLPGMELGAGIIMLLH